MDHFVLSPGITPFVTDVTLLAFAGLLGLGYLLRGGLGVLGGIAVDAIAMAVYKLATDLPDPYDDLVSLAALLLGAVLVTALLRGRLPGSSHAWTAIGIVGALLAVSKVLSDFYDPWDLLLAIDLGLLAMYLAVPSVRRRDGLTPPKAARAGG